MPKSLPDRANLEHLRREAKALLAAARRREPTALARFQAALPHLATSPRLHDAQSAVAREYGFPSWAKLKRHVERLAHDVPIRFVEAALQGDLDTARRILAESPNVLQSSAAALVYGELPNGLDVNAKLAPRDWPPILYVVFSRFLGRESERHPRLVEAGRQLINAGADPNAAWTDPQYPEWPETALYGASGVNDCPELTELLLAAGANPSDGEAIYHSIEHRNLQCLRLILAADANTRGANALPHMLDFDDLEGLRLLLDHGADVREHPILHHALTRGRSLPFFQTLLAYGAEIEARDEQGFPPYVQARRMGRNDVADLLLAHGAKDDLTPLDRFVAACARKDEGALERILKQNPDIGRGLSRVEASAIVSAAMHGNEFAVVTMLRAGFDAGVRALGLYEPTALHWAGYHGYTAITRELLRHGPPLEVRDTHYHATPLGWAATGAGRHANPAGDYAGTIDELLAAGADPTEVDFTYARESPHVGEVLSRYGR